MGVMPLAPSCSTSCGGGTCEVLLLRNRPVDVTIAMQGPRKRHYECLREGLAPLRSRQEHR